MQDQINNSPPAGTPTWWAGDHERGWDRVKAAFRRDWEQTKSDLSAGRSGVDLNQSIGDTMKQATGKEPIPPQGATNPMDADEAEGHVRRAARRMAREAERFTRDGARSASVGEVAARGPYDWANWETAERPLRYGHAASLQYGADWTSTTEDRLRAEWTELNPDLAWDDVRDTVRLGWGPGRF